MSRDLPEKEVQERFAAQIALGGALNNLRGRFMPDQSAIDKLLSERFGGVSLPAAYRAVAEALLVGRSRILVAPDHHLRALTWQIAAALGSRPVLVITSSAQDLAARAENVASRIGLVTCRMDSETTDTGLATLVNQFGKGRWDAALCSARHLGDPRVMEVAQALRPRLVVVEEAHCLSRHGRRFDPCFRRAVPLSRQAGCVLALSDVADRTGRSEISDALDIEGDPVMIGLDLPHLRLEVRNTPGESQREANLLELMSSRPQRAIVFTGMGVEADRITWLMEHICDLSTVNLTSADAAEFAAALRLFREGGTRVLVTSGPPTPDLAAHNERRLEVPLVVTASPPGDLETLHRQSRLATGEGARAVLLYDRNHRETLERKSLRCAPETGHLLAIHRAIDDAERASYEMLSVITGLHPDGVHLGVEMLLDADALATKGRGDRWLEAVATGPPRPESLIDVAKNALLLRQARIEKVERLLRYARSRGCRREALGRALGYEIAGEPCRCDRCAPMPMETAFRPAPRGYPVETENVKGWVLGLYPQADGYGRDAGDPGELVRRLEYDGDETALQPLAEMLASAVQRQSYLRDCELIVPIPPRDTDAPESTSILLAERLSTALAVPMVNALTSTDESAARRDPEFMEAERQYTATGWAIAHSDTIRDETVLLVDGIFDSGATVEKVAGLLRRAGAGDVRVLAAVRTVSGWRPGF